MPLTSLRELIHLAAGLLLWLLVNSLRERRIFILSDLSLSHTQMQRHRQQFYLWTELTVHLLEAHSMSQRGGDRVMEDLSDKEAE